MTIKTIQIWDFDGTICDSSHRYRTQICEDGVERIDLQYWIDNECRTIEDRPIPETLARFKEACNDPEIFAVIATARIWCEQSQKWAEMYGIEPNAIYARRDRSDTRGGAALKIQAIKKLLNLKQFEKVDKIQVFEDNVSYLKAICDAFKDRNSEGFYFPSNQGH